MRRLAVPIIYEFLSLPACLIQISTSPWANVCQTPRAADWNLLMRRFSRANHFLNYIIASLRLTFDLVYVLSVLINNSRIVEDFKLMKFHMEYWKYNNLLIETDRWAYQLQNIFNTVQQKTTTHNTQKRLKIARSPRAVQYII